MHRYTYVKIQQHYGFTLSNTKINNLKIVTMNCRGLAGRQKRRDVFNFFKNSDVDIICLQDIHCSEKSRRYFSMLWRGQALFSCFTSNSRGVCLLFRKSLKINVLSEHRDQSGNIIAAFFQYGHESYHIINIYGPNTDSPQFFADIDKLLCENDANHTIVCGDFNLVLDQQWDTLNYLTENNVQSREKVLKIMVKHDLKDIWRVMNPNTKTFSWTKPNPLKKARLDLFLIKSTDIRLVERCEILPGYRSDHERVFLSMLTPSYTRGPGLWKFNASLMRDQTYVQLIKDLIRSEVRKYASPLYSENFFERDNCAEDVHFIINDALFFENLLMMIRGATVQFSKHKARMRRKQQDDILQKIQRINSHIAGSPSPDIVARVAQLQLELEQLRKPIIEGLLIRSKATWHEEAEHPSKYFLALEKEHNTGKSIERLEEDDTVYIGTKEVLNRFSKHLQERYATCGENMIDLSLLESCNLPYLSETDRNDLDSPITIRELDECVKHMKGGKSPGSNGYTIEFFKGFWTDLRHYLHRCILHIQRSNEMSPVFREGIITLIPKSPEHAQKLKGWRPISLLNVDFKIFSAVVARRLKSVIGSIISPEQTAYTKGRFIGENIRLTYDIIKHCNDNEEDGILIAADFQSAFETVNWSFLAAVMEKVNIGAVFINLVKLLYLNVNNFARIMLNGLLGDKIFLERGIRQGDPASGYLFNIAVSVLTKMILSSPILRGIRITPDLEIRISQYADDTCLFISGSRTSLDGAFRELGRFSAASGLQLNHAKTKCLALGKTEPAIVDPLLEFSWVTELKILGISFRSQIDNIADENVKTKLISIIPLVERWRRRGLTLIGKITLIKSLFMSRLVYVLTSLPNPKPETVQEIQNIFWKFLWDGKPDKIKRSTLLQSYGSDGLNMISVKHFIQSLKISWLQRLWSANVTLCQIFKHSVGYDLSEILMFGSAMLKKVKSRIRNPFWIDVIAAWEIFVRSYRPVGEEMVRERIWFSDHSRFKTSIIRSWDSRGIRFIGDIWNFMSNQIMLRAEIENTYSIHISFLDYESLLRSLSNTLRHVNTPTDFAQPTLPPRIELVTNQNKIGKLAYSILIANEIEHNDNNCRDKWVQDIGDYEKGSLLKLTIATRSVRLRNFHYKLIRRIIARNRLLYVCGISEDPNCSFCGRNEETIYHLFWECPISQNFIRDISRAFLVVGYDIKITRQTWFLLKYCNSLDTLILTLAKYVLYRAKLMETRPSVAHFRAALLSEKEIEHYVAALDNKLDTHIKKWTPLERIDTHWVRTS